MQSFLSMPGGANASSAASRPRWLFWKIDSETVRLVHSDVLRKTQLDKTWSCRPVPARWKQAHACNLARQIAFKWQQ